MGLKVHQDGFKLVNSQVVECASLRERGKCKPPKKWQMPVIVSPCATFEFAEVHNLTLLHLLCVCCWFWIRK